MTAKCKIKMGDKLLPVPGSACAKGETGTCPECLTPGVLLSVVGGFIRAHVIADRAVPENNPQPPTLIVESVKYGKGLVEPITALTDSGLRVGDPRQAEHRRVAQIEGAAGTGTVQVPRRVQGKGVTKSGAPRMTTKLVDVPGTEEHTREALDYWRKRRLTSDAMRKRQNEMVSILSRRLEAILGAQEFRYNAASRVMDIVAPPVAKQPAMSAKLDTAAAHRGPTLVRGRDTTPRTRDPETPWSEATDRRSNGEVRLMTTLDQPLGRERFDRKITDVPEPPKRRTETERRRYRRQQKALGLAKG